MHAWGINYAHWLCLWMHFQGGLTGEGRWAPMNGSDSIPWPEVLEEKVSGTPASPIRWFPSHPAVSEQSPCFCCHNHKLLPLPFFFSSTVGYSLKPWAQTNSSFKLILIMHLVTAMKWLTTLSTTADSHWRGYLAFKKAVKSFILSSSPFPLLLQ